MNIEKIEQQITNLDKRADDIKSFVNTFSGSIAILVTALSILGGMNLYSEKASLKDFKEQTMSQIDKKLGEVSNPPKLELLNIHGGKLEGSLIEITQDINDNNITQIHIPYRIYNTGGAWSKSLFGKIYAKEPLSLPDNAALNSNYESESFISYNHFNPRQIPSGVSIQTTMNFKIINNFPSNQITEVLYILSYGNGLTSKAKFNIIYRNK